MTIISIRQSTPIYAAEIRSCHIRPLVSSSERHAVDNRSDARDFPISAEEAQVECQHPQGDGIEIEQCSCHEDAAKKEQVRRKRALLLKRLSELRAHCIEVALYLLGGEQRANSLRLQTLRAHAGDPLSTFSASVASDARPARQTAPVRRSLSKAPPCSRLNP